MTYSRDPHHDVMILIPSVAAVKNLVPCVERLTRFAFDGFRVHLVVSVNPIPSTEQEASNAVAGVLRIWEGHNAVCPDNTLTIVRSDGPRGFGGAINRGLEGALMGEQAYLTPLEQTWPGSHGLSDYVQHIRGARVEGIPEFVIIYNDDIKAVSGWLRAMLEAAKDPEIEVASELIEAKTQKARKRSAADYGRIGLWGPMSNCAAGQQQLSAQNVAAYNERGVDDFAAEWMNLHAGVVKTADFLSGFCLMMSLDLINAVVRPGHKLFDERYTIAGFEDNDLCVRADRAGFRSAVVCSSFLGHDGHQTFDSAFPEMQRGMRNRGVYYDIWGNVEAKNELNGKRRIVACYRVKFETAFDLVLFRKSLSSILGMADGVCVVLNGDVSSIVTDRELTRAEDIALVQAVQSGASYPEALKRWIATHIQACAQGRQVGQPEVRTRAITVRPWTGPFNEREERNFLLDLAKNQMQANWILSIDHDEALEARVASAGRYHWERLMDHPDPMVSQWNIGFVNHWHTEEVVRLDRPWGDGGRYTDGQAGYRFFRTNPAVNDTILAGGNNGLHCGNIPARDGSAKREAAIRIQHFGYMRAEDRHRKQRRYNVQDPEPDFYLVGGHNYNHITRDEGCTTAPFVRKNGIGIHFLFHAGEGLEGMARNLDKFYGLADRVVAVWTGEWDDADKAWLGAGIAPGAVPAPPGTPVGARGFSWLVGSILGHQGEWPKTGPSYEVAKMLWHFGVEILHHPLNDDFAAARNAGINALDKTPGMGWTWTFDPDENYGMFAGLGLRKMAERSDNVGWIFQFVNPHENGRHTVSDSIRMARLDPEGRMRYAGRVHETYEAATHWFTDHGHDIKLVQAAETMQAYNTGLSLDPHRMQAKIDRYRYLTEMELRDNPDNATAWITLAMYWENERCFPISEICLKNASCCTHAGFLTHAQMATLYLRRALPFQQLAVENMGGLRGGDYERKKLAFLEECGAPVAELGIITTMPPGAKRFSDEEALASLPDFPIEIVLRTQKRLEAGND